MRRRFAMVGALAVAVASLGLVGGEAGAVPPEIEVSPSALDFGVVNQGQTSAPQDVVVTNTSGRPVGPVSIAGAVPPPETQATVFALDDRCTGLTLQPRSSCVLRYTFRPWYVHASRAELDVQVVEQGQPVGAAFPVTLTGDGANPLVVSPTVVDFGAVPIGVTSTARLRVSNPSAQPFELSTLAFSTNLEPPFGIDLESCWGVVLPPGGSCELPISFRPDAPGPATVAADLGISATNNHASVLFPYEVRGCGATPASACAADVPPPSSTSTSTTTASSSTVTTSPPVDPTTAPPTSTTSSEPAIVPSTDEAPTVGGGSAGSALPRTGSEPAPLLAGGLVLLLAGGALVGIARRRRLRLPA